MNKNYKNKLRTTAILFMAVVFLCLIGGVITLNNKVKNYKIANTELVQLSGKLKQENAMNAGKLDDCIEANERAREHIKELEAEKAELNSSIDSLLTENKVLKAKVTELKQQTQQTQSSSN